MAAPLDKDNQPYHLRKYNEHELNLRTTLADQIGNIALHLKCRGVIRDYEYKEILTGVDTKPDECVSKLIEVLKKYEGGQFDQFMTCLTDLGYGNLVKEIRGNEEMEEYEEIDPSGT
ncbi:hypothetical protein SNE40_001918 [Patella caerulea]|uniref:CARD domain-containing protein n=1 Tax=Patella caerulea TaxID=87958 RepID=A0AAN8KBB0_PATCE